MICTFTKQTFEDALIHHENFYIGCHTYPPNIGNQMLTDRVILYHHNGIFIGYYNDRLKFYVSTDPKAEWSRGEPLPISSTATLRELDEIPKNLNINKYVTQAIIAVNKLVAQYVAERARRAKEAKGFLTEEEERLNRMMTDNWKIKSNETN